MSNFEAVRVAVATYVANAWTIAGNPAPLQMPNTDQIDVDDGALYVDFQMRWRGAAQASLENVPTTRRDGEVWFDIYVPLGKGTKPATTLADTITGFLQYVKVLNVQFLPARLLPPQEVKAYEVHRLAFSFFYRE